MKDSSLLDEVAVGSSALTSEQIEYIKILKYQAQISNLNISSMEIVAGGSELDVHYGGVSYYVKYSFFEDPRKSSGVFFATKETLDNKSEVPTEYIDVRVPQRAYVK